MNKQLKVNTSYTYRLRGHSTLASSKRSPADFLAFSCCCYCCRYEQGEQVTISIETTCKPQVQNAHMMMMVMMMMTHAHPAPEPRIITTTSLASVLTGSVTCCDTECFYQYLARLLKTLQRNHVNVKAGLCAYQMMR